MLRETDVFDAQGFAFADLGEPKAPTLVTVEQGAHGAAATIADAHLLFNSDFTRSGNDLHIDGHSGDRAIVRDYFSSGERAALMSHEGARLTPDLVEALTKSDAPHQYAQATPPAPAANDAVGRVVTASPDSTILRNGVPVTVASGDPVLRADVLQTAGGTMAVTFNDGSTLNLTANTRIVVSEFIYSPSNTGNSQLLDLIQGSLTFISGEVAHTGDMRIGTPVATMGIRGTVGGVTTASDGTVQFYVSQSTTGAVIINQQGQIIANVVQDGPLIVVRPVGPLEVIADEIQKSPAQLAVELQALQQIVNIKAVGDQLLQQFFQQQQQQNPNPQSPQNGPHTQIPVDDKVKITLFQDDNEGNNGSTSPPTHAVIETIVDDPDVPPTPFSVPVIVNLPPITFAPLSVTTAEDTPLVFSGSRAISVVDTDSQTITVTLSVTNGVLSLGSVTGLSFGAGDGASDGTMAFSGSPAAIAAALNGLTYTPAQDYNGAAVLSITKTDGNSDPTTTTVTVNVTPVNDAPVIVGSATVDLPQIEGAGPDGNLEPDAALQAQIDASPAVQNALSGLLTVPAGVITVALATVQDELNVDTATAMTVVWDYLDDIYVSAGPHQANVNEAFTRLGIEYAKYLKDGGAPLTAITAKYAPDGNSNGTPDREQSLHDNLLGNLGAGALNQRYGGNPALLAELTALINGVDPDLLTRPYYSGNDTSSPASVEAWDLANGFAPAVFTENGAPVVVNAALTLSDVDSATLTGATVKIVANFASGEDVLSFTAQGGITGSYNAQTGILTLSGSASLADYQAVLRSVAYENTSGNPSNAPRTIEFQVNDGSAQHSASNVVSTVVEVSPANDAPVLTLGGHVADQFDSQAYNLNSGTANWTTDWIENENGDYASSPADGEIRVATDPAVSESGFRLFLSDDDNESGAADAIQRSADLSGASSATLTFDYRRQIEWGDQDDVVKIWASDDGVNFTLIGEIGATQGSIIDETYQHFSVDISGYISSTTTIRFSIDDGVDNGDEFYIDNVKIEYAASPTYVEGGSAVSIAPLGASIKDADNTTLQSATITLTNAQAGDLLSVNGQLPAGIVASSYDTQTGVLALTGEATLADYRAALAQIQFSNTGDDPGSCDRTIEVVVSDGSASSNTGTVTVHVTPVNDAPQSPDSANPATFTEDTDTVIPFSALLANASDPDGDMLSIVNVGSTSAYGGTVTVNGTDITYHPAANFTGFDYFLYSVTDGQETITRAATFTVAAVNDAPVLDAHGAALSYSEDQTAATIAPSITVTDVDSAQLAGATVQITGNLDASEDVLGFVNQNGITGSYNSTTGLLTLAGLATVAQYQAALASVTYANGAALSTATRTVSFTVDDGQGTNHASNTVTVDITVAAVNDMMNLTASAWAASGAIDLGGGVNVLNVAADGSDISAASTPTVAHVETGNLTGTGGTDSITLTGLQLDNIIIGDGTIDLGLGSGDTINLKSTSADLNTLGATDASIVGVEAISAAGAGAGVTITLTGQTEAFTITGSANADTLIGGSGNDTISGGDGNDVLTGGAGADDLNGGAGADTFVMTSPGDLTGDIIDGIHDNANDDTIRLDGAGTYNFSAATVSNIDSVNIAVNAAGFNIVLTDDMASTAAYKGTNTAIEGRIRVNATVAVSNDVTIDASDLQAGHRLFVNASNLGGNDTIIGGAGADNINGGAGNDRITGGGGDDDMNGGTGADTFVFHAGFGIDTVSGFDETLDYLQFDQGIFANVAALLAATTDSGANTVIQYDASNKVTLEGVQKADLLAHTDHILIV